MPLTSYINHAALDATLAGFIEIKNSYLPTNTFLSNNNLLQSDINNIGARGGPYTISPNDTITYLAASSLVHCFDGWNYLSSCIDNFLKGEKYISIHLGYYAELRASMSFLATEGIGIFNNVHLAVDRASNTITSPSLSSINANGTHKFLWEALDAWIIHKQAINTLKYFSLNGKTFEDWVGYIPGASNPGVISLIVKSWLRTWCFDISNYRNDREGRNKFSYRPTRIADFSIDNLNDKLLEINKLWKLLEPDPSNRFSVLDKYLFIILFKEIYQILSSNSGGNILPIESLLENTFKNAGLSLDNQLKSMLTLQKHPIFSHAQDTVLDSYGHTKPLSIIARAILMLRFCSGATAYLLKTANITRNELEFYWDIIGYDFGFWNTTSKPSSFDSLWDFVNDSIIDIEGWTSSHQGNIDLESMYNQNISTLPYYTQFVRAGLWGTGF